MAPVFYIGRTVSAKTTRWIVLWGVVGVACGDGAAVDPVSGGRADAGDLDASAVDGDPRGVVDASALSDGGASDSGVTSDGGPALGFEGEVAIAGARTYVRWTATSTSTMPPVVVLPTGLHMGGVPALFGNIGGGIGHEYLPAPLAFLERTRDVIYFDFLASGRSGFGSTETSSVTSEIHVEQVEHVLTWLRQVRGSSGAQGGQGGDAQSDLRVDLIGHGYGGGIAALFAARHPEQVDRLVLIDPMGLDLAQFSESIVALQGRLTAGDRERLDGYTRHVSCRRDPSRCMLDVWRILVPRMMCPENETEGTALDFRFGDYRGYTYIEKNLRQTDFDWALRIATIQAPALVMRSACDVIPSRVADAYVRLIPGAKLEVFEASGHFPMVEEPGRFRALVESALARP
ncbi:MAG: alpha/beta hydrolase [Deltaproteobacteria bacterium]|nr:alpha/beta hydrolase [Deltaproteobacteria bacterium]